MANPRLLNAAAIMAIVVLGVVVLVYAKPFLVPRSFAAILSMVLLPITRWLERKGFNKAFAVICAILVLVGFFVLVGFLVGKQVSDIAGNSSQIEQQVSAKYQQLTQFIAQKAGIPPGKQQEMLQKQQQSSSGNTSSMITGFLAGLSSVLTDTLLVLVYIFLFIYFRSKLKGFIVRLVPPEHVPKAVATVNGAQKVSQDYLVGMFWMIVCLWVMYGIGFSIVGVKNALFFAIICGLMEIIPFVGNLAGTALTIIMSMAQGGDTNIIIGILITYFIVQFIQSYLLEPLVVGAEVNINPLFTIIGLVAGEILWGIPGMVLAIPLMGMAKIICDHVAPLRPYAYLIGEDKKKEDEGGFKQKIKAFGQKVKGWVGA
jgi:predicted PurR-regulated permease PerM